MPTHQEAPSTDLLGPELMALINNLISLMKRTTDPQELDALDEQRIAFSDEAARLIGGVLDGTTAEYHTALESLRQTSETIVKAIRGVEAVNEVILRAARTAALVGKVAAMA
jgi:hypothetical protein